MKRKALILCYFSPIPTWKGTIMGLKYCDKCHEAVEQIVMVCPKCKSEMFVHGAEMWKRVKDEPTPPKRVTPKTTTAETEVAPTPTSTPSTSQRSQDFFVGNSKTGKTIDDLIRAQNRTTHAVRAFVRFLFIQLTGITLAVFLWNVSLAFIDEQACFQYGDNCTGNAFLQFMAGIVWLVAVILSSRAGWDELNKSNIE